MHQRSSFYPNVRRSGTMPVIDFALDAKSRESRTLNAFDSFT